MAKRRSKKTVRRGRSTHRSTKNSKKKANKVRAEQHEQAQKCRQYVINAVVVDKGSVLIAEAANDFHRSPSAVRNDLQKYYVPKNLPIRIRRHRFVYDDSRLTTEAKRESENRSAKSKIGKQGALLVVGTDRSDAQSKSDPVAWLTPQSDDVLFPERLKDKLAVYYTKPHRLAILDSGSTNLAIARALADFKTPAPSRHLNSLRVLTNGRRVSEALAEPDSTHGIILLGGALRRDTEAVAGLLAERCLESWLLHTSDAAMADLAIVGTTNVNENFDLYSDSETESEMKSRLLNAARIRCICADSAKLMRRSGGNWAFCGFASSMIDLVITDDEILAVQDKQHLENGRKEFLNRAKKADIFVAVAR